MLLASTEGGRAAVAPLQKALALIDREMPQRVFEAIGVVGRALLTEGHIVAAQAHLWLHVGLAPKDDPRALELLVSLNHYSGLPLLAARQLADARLAGRRELEGRSRRRRRGWPINGKWLQAVEIIDRLGGTHGAVPTLLYNRAVLAGRLADDRALVAGLHAYAQMEVPLDDAVEAEADRPTARHRGQRAAARLGRPRLRDQRLDALVARARRPTGASNISKSIRRGSQAATSRGRGTRTCCFDQPLPESGVGIQRGTRCRAWPA